MKKYTGTKTLLAVAMTLGAYNEKRGWPTPDDEDPETAGYLVEYEKGGKANHPDHVGYISWSPADVFEDTYFESGDTDAKGRVQTELSELSDKFEALIAFQKSDAHSALNKDNQRMLRIQKRAMLDYGNALARRLEIWVDLPVE